MSKQKNKGSHGRSLVAPPVTAADITANWTHVNGQQMKAMLAGIRKAERTGKPFSPMTRLLWEHGNSQRCADAMASLLSTSKNTNSLVAGQLTTLPISESA